MAPVSFALIYLLLYSTWATHDGCCFDGQWLGTCGLQGDVHPASSAVPEMGFLIEHPQVKWMQGLLEEKGCSGNLNKTPQLDVQLRTVSNEWFPVKAYMYGNEDSMPYCKKGNGS